jgi:HAD superfamily hydrolase (TIGR01509 family)
MTDDRLAEVLHRARALLLDFDGPVCSIFAGYPPLKVTARLRPLLPDGGAELAAEAGPHDALHYATRFPPAVVRRIEQELHDAEVEAAETATPTPGAVELLQAAQGMPVAIVSNNTADAVRRYLDREKLTPCLRDIQGRPPTDPALMKPSPYMVLRALRTLGVAPAEAVLLGDAESDIQAAHLAGVSCVGFANKAGKGARLATAGADAVVTDVFRVACHFGPT